MKSLFKVPVILSIFINSLFAQPGELISDNGTLKVKLDLTRGGAISYISASGSSRNLVNIYDEGRYIQQSYYAGKRLDRKAEGQSPKWSPWSWNPVQAGDEFHNRAKILSFSKSGDTLTVKCIPMQWDMNNRACEAVIEQTTILLGNTLKVHCKLTCHRTDLIYGEGIASNQELPAVYTISSLNHLYSYFGNKPFTKDTLSSPAVVSLESGFWGEYSNVTEHWMAFVDSCGWGLGVYNPHCNSFLAGMAGNPGKESNDGATSYIAPVSVERLKKNSILEYDYYLIVGSIEEIRSRIYEINKADE